MWNLKWIANLRYANFHVMLLQREKRGENTKGTILPPISISLKKNLPFHLDNHTIVVCILAKFAFHMLGGQAECFISLDEANFVLVEQSYQYNICYECCRSTQVQLVHTKISWAATIIRWVQNLTPDQCMQFTRFNEHWRSLAHMLMFRRDHVNERFESHFCSVNGFCRLHSAAGDLFVA